MQRHTIGEEYFQAKAAGTAQKYGESTDVTVDPVKTITSCSTVASIIVILRSRRLLFSASAFEWHFVSVNCSGRGRLSLEESSTNVFSTLLSLELTTFIDKSDTRMLNLKNSQSRWPVLVDECVCAIE